jgi:MSHA biogenesis protein MshQ
MLRHLSCRSLLLCLLLLPVHWGVWAALVAEYRFEQSSYNGTAGEVTDTSGNGNHGKVVRSSASLAYPASTASGHSCRGLSIPQNTTADIQAMDTGIDVNTLGQTGSVSFWYKATGTGSSAHRALVDATMSTASRFLFWRDDHGSTVDLYFYASDSGGSRKDVHEVNVIVDDVWAHIAYTWTAAANRMKIYVDGVEVGSDTDSFSGGALNTAIGTLYVGDNRSASSDELLSAYGIIDQVRVYNHEMSAAEVAADKANEPSCVTLHHLELTTTSSSATAGSNVIVTLNACADAACTTFYTGGVTGTLTVTGTGLSPTYVTGAAFSIGVGSASTTETFSVTPTGTATIGLTGVSPTPANASPVFCGMGVAAASGNSCNLSVTSGLHHVELTATSASTLTCTPVTYTVKACANAACSSLYTSGLTGSLSVSGTTVNYPSGAGFTIGSGASSTTVSAHQTTTGTATATLTGLSVTPSGSPGIYCGMGVAAASGGACGITMASAGLLFDVPDHVADVAQSVTVSAVRSSDNALQCTPAFASVSKNVTFKCSYGNPGSGTLPLRAGGAALNVGNNSAEACDATGRAVSLSFNASGVASTTFQYADVGQVSLSATYTGSGADAGLSMAGSDTFVAKPASLSVSGVTSGTLRAGSSFAATVTARNHSGAAVPNFGKETPATTDYVRLSWAKASPTGTGAQAGTLTGTGSGGAPYLSSSGFSHGAVAVGDLKWSEVGSGDLTATFVPATYLGVATTASGSTGTAGAIGPFVPDHFDTALTQGCGSFTYSGQPFALEVSARNALNGITANYNGTASTSPILARTVTLSAATSAALGSFTSGTVASSSFVAGVASVGTGAFTFTSKLTAPATVTVRATEAIDGITSSGGAEGAVLLRSGRLRVNNAYGSDKKALTLPVQAQHWSGKAWVLNSLDGCTVVPVAAVAMGNHLDAKGNATTGWSTSVTANGSGKAVSLSGGNGVLTLAKPTSGSSQAAVGSVDIGFNLGSTASDAACLGTPRPSTTGAGLSWLRSQFGSAHACAGAVDYLRDPSARATFGVHAPELHRTIHTTEAP